MKIRLPALFCFAAFVLTGCDVYTPLYKYTPASYTRDAMYQLKPMSSDSARSANYIAANIADGSGLSSDNLADNIFIAQLYFSHAQTFDNFNLSYGAFGYTGNYTNKSIPASNALNFDSKSFLGFGGRLSADYFIKYKNADFRIIGFEATYSQESGPFSTFRNSLNTQNFYADKTNSVLSAGVTSEIIWHFKKRAYIENGIRMYIGGYLNQHQLVSINNNTASTQQSNFALSYFLKVKHVFFVANLNSQSAGLSAGYSF